MRAEKHLRELTTTIEEKTTGDRNSLQDYILTW